MNQNLSLELLMATTEGETRQSSKRRILLLLNLLNRRAALLRPFNCATMRLVTAR